MEDEHCKFCFEGFEVNFEAIGSNCYVNGMKVNAPIQVKHNDRLIIGLKYVFRFQFPKLNKLELRSEKITWHSVRQEVTEKSGINLKRVFERAQSTDREELKTLLVKYKDKIVDLESEKTSLESEKEELVKKYESLNNYQKTMENMYKKEIDSKEERYKEEIRQYEDALIELQTQLNEMEDESASSASVSFSNNDSLGSPSITEDNIQSITHFFNLWRNYRIRVLRNILTEFETLVEEANELSKNSDKKLGFKLKVASHSLYTSVPNEALSGKFASKGRGFESRSCPKFFR